MNYDLISFDLDGTLVDTAGEIAEAANLTLEAHGLARRAVAEITALIGAGTRELMRDLLARRAQEHPPSVQHLHIDAVMAIFDRHYTVITGSLGVPYSGCQEALSALRIAGLRLACTTNKELRHARHVLEVTQLESFFDLVVGGDTLPQKKPHGSVLGHVMRTLGARAGRTAHVGDSSIDVQAARSAGVHAWAVPYGYNRGQPIAACRPDRIFANLLEVSRHVLATPTAGIAPAP